MHYINVRAQRLELADARFAPDPLVYANDGSPIFGDASTTRVLHWMARAPELSDSARVFQFPLRGG